MGYFIDLAVYLFLGVALLIAGLKSFKKGRSFLFQAQKYVKIVLGAATWVILVLLSFLVYLFLRYRARLIFLGFVLGIALGFIYVLHYGAPPDVALGSVLTVALGVALGIALLIAGIKLAKRRSNLALRAMGYGAAVLGPAFGGYLVLYWLWWLHFSYHD